MRLDPQAFTPLEQAADHTRLRLAPEQGYGYARTWAEVPVHGRELTELVSVVPLAFCPRGDFPVVGLLGIETDTNLFVGPKGGWGGVAVPEAVTSYPFLTRPVGEGKGTLCADLDSDRLARDLGEPIFEADGTPTPRLAEIRDTAARQLRERRRLKQAVAALAEAGVLRPWSAEGVFTLDPERHAYVAIQVLNQLEDAAFLELRRGGALALTYTQRHSLANLRKLRRMSQRRQPRAGVAYEQVFDEPQELDFDWSASTISRRMRATTARRRENITRLGSLARRRGAALGKYPQP